MLKLVEPFWITVELVVEVQFDTIRSVQSQSNPKRLLNINLYISHWSWSNKLN